MEAAKVVLEGPPPISARARVLLLEVWQPALDPAFQVRLPAVSIRLQRDLDRRALEPPADHPSRVRNLPGSLEDHGSNGRCGMTSFLAPPRGALEVLEDRVEVPAVDFRADGACVLLTPCVAQHLDDHRRVHFSCPEEAEGAGPRGVQEGRKLRMAVR